MKISLPILAVGGVAAVGWFRAKKTKRPKVAPPTVDRPPVADANEPPIVAGTACEEVASDPVVEAWLGREVRPRLSKELDALSLDPRFGPYFVPVLPQGVTLAQFAERQQAILWWLVEDAATETLLECPGRENASVTDAYAYVWKAMWCVAIQELVAREVYPGDEAEVGVLCGDPDFDPRRDPPPSLDAVIPEVPPVEPAIPEEPLEPPRGEPPIPPLPPLPMASMDGGGDPVPPLPLGPVVPPAPPGPAPGPRPPAPDGPPGAFAPDNVVTLSDGRDLNVLGFDRLAEAVPERIDQVEARSTVVLGFDPEWGDVQRAKAAMHATAQAHPEVQFALVSFWDTQRVFGKPEKLGVLKFVLTATDPEGYAFQRPLVGRDDAAAPGASAWSLLVDFALRDPPVNTATVTPNPGPRPAAPGTPAWVHAAARSIAVQQQAAARPAPLRPRPAARAGWRMPVTPMLRLRRTAQRRGKGRRSRKGLGR